MLKNRSGQFIYFTLVSALSGNQVAGASGSISGTKSLDGLSGMIVLSGNVIELGNGSYRANLFDFDTNGDQAGYLFTASGCVPVQYQFDMIDGNGSGRFYLGSGSVGSGVINSGIFVSVGPASLSGVVANSGLFVSVPVATLSGVQPISGTFVSVPTASISGVQFGSGGTVSLSSGQVYPHSGAYATEIPKGVLTYDYSGAPEVSGMRNLLNATRKLINRFDLTAFSGRLAVYKEDDATLAYFQNVTTASGAVPITKTTGA